MTMPLTYTRGLHSRPWAEVGSREDILESEIMMLNVQPLTDLLLSLPAALKVTVLLATILLSEGLTKTTLRLHQQGFLKAIPTAVVVLSGTVAGYVVGGPVVALLTAMCTLCALFITSGIRRAVKRSLQLRQYIDQIQARYKH